MLKENKLIDNLRFNIIPASGTKKANVLVIEPIDVSKHEKLAEYFPDVEFYILDSDCELLETDLGVEPGIKGKLNKIFSEYKYDYAIVYLNELFDENILRKARLKGIFSFATAIHNIDIDAATKYRTLVTNTPSLSSSAVAEQNIAFSLHSIFSSYLLPKDQSLKLSQVDLTPTQSNSVAQLLWYCLLKHALRLDEMFEFGLSQYYVRLGVGENSTVYHEQLGQGEYEKSNCSIGIIGLDSIGMRLVEISIAHEIATIYLVEEEVTSKKLSRLYKYIDIIKVVSPNKLDISIRIVSVKYLLDNSDYVVKTRCGYISTVDSRKIIIDYENIYVSDRSVVDFSLENHILGIQGLGNIGYAAAQRYCSLSCSIRAFDPRQKEPSYIKKINNLKFLGKNTISSLTNNASRQISIDFVTQNAIYKECDFIIFLNSSNYEGSRIVHQELLSTLKKRTDKTIVISQVHGAFDETYMSELLKNNGNIWLYMDALTEEHRGNVINRFCDGNGLPLKNTYFSGHTAAAVKELREAKIDNAFMNLRMVLDGEIPNNLVNSELCKNIHSDEY